MNEMNEMKWIEMDECTPPLHGKDYLFLYNGTFNRARWDDVHKVARATYYGTMEHPEGLVLPATHWMDLPNPPNPPFEFDTLDQVQEYIDKILDISYVRGIS